MGVLSSIPVWVYFIVLLITYMATHVLTFDPARGLRGRAAFVTRIGASLLLLLALIAFDREEPATLLIALLLAGLGGFLSGRSTPPPKTVDRTGSEPEEESGPGAA